jgi:trehalose-6-phosphate synthase
MSFEEKHRRMLSMRHVVSWNQLHDWAGGFLRQAVRI